MKLKITNTDKVFRVVVVDAKEKEIYSCGWQGGEFAYKSEWYGVFGPYHSLDGDKFRVYKLVPVTEPA